MMASSSSQQRRRRRRPEEVWDANGDGQLDVNDLLHKFDADESGTLDRKELLPLLKQILQQTEFTNALLEQLQTLEEKNSEMAREAKEKQKKMVSYAVMGEGLRHENDELKRRLIAAERARSAADAELKELRGVVDGLKREAASERQASVEAARAAAEAVGTNDALGREVEALRNRATAAEESLSRGDATLREELEAAVGDRDAARTELAATRRERDDLRRGVASARDAEADAAKRRDEAQRALGGSQTREREAVQAKREAEKRVEAALGEAREAKARAAVCEETARKQRATIDEAGAQLEKRDAQLVELAEAKRDLAEENEALQTDLKKAGDELVSMAKKFSREKEQLEAKLKDATEKRAKAVRQAKEQACEHALDVARRAAEDVEARRDAEAAYVKLQGEHAEVHELLGAARRDAARAARRSADAETRAARAEGSVAADKKAWEEQIEAAKAREVELESALEDKTSELDRVSTDAAVRSALVATEADERVVAAREACAQLATDLAKLQRRAKTLREYHQSCRRDYLEKPLAACRSETADAVAALVAKLADAKRATKTSAETVAGLEAKNAEADDQLRALRDEVEAAKADAAAAREERDDADAAHAERLRADRAAIDAAETRRADADDRAKRLQHALDDALARSKTAEQDKRALQAELSAAQTELGARDGAIDARHAETQKQLRAATSAAEAAAAKHADLEHQLDDHRADLARLRADKRAADSDLAKLQTDRNHSESTFRAELAALNTNVATLTKQAALLKQNLVLKQRRCDEVADENAQLKAELNTLVHASMSHPTTPA